MVALRYAARTLGRFTLRRPQGFGISSFAAEDQQRFLPRLINTNVRYMLCKIHKFNCFPVHWWIANCSSYCPVLIIYKNHFNYILFLVTHACNAYVYTIKYDHPLMTYSSNRHLLSVGSGNALDTSELLWEQNRVVFSGHTWLHAIKSQHKNNSTIHIHGKACA